MIPTGRIYRYLSSSLIIIMCVAGLLQYHHHDCNGDACMTLSVKEIDLSEWNSTDGCHALHHRCQKTDNEEHSHSCGDNCGLHISGSIDTTQLSGSHNGLISVQLIFSTRCGDTLADLCHESTATPAFYKNVSIPQEIILSAIDNRGSPV